MSIKALDLNHLTPARRTTVVCLSRWCFYFCREIKYIPLYANGKEPVIGELDVFRIEIPYAPSLQSTEGGSGQKSGPKSGPETTQKRIIKLLRDNPNITSRQIAENLKMARSGISKHLHLL